MSILSDVNPIAGDALFLLSKFRGVIFLPATKKEEIIFTCMMAFGMVLDMSSYNALWNLGWQGPWFQAALHNMLREYWVALPVAYFIGSPLAFRLARRYWHQKKTFPIGMGIATPLLMVPMMTTLIHFLFLHTTSPQILFPAYLRNYLFAWPLQLLLVGPLVRFLFRRLMAAGK